MCCKRLHTRRSTLQMSISNFSIPSIPTSKLAASGSRDRLTPSACQSRQHVRLDPRRQNRPSLIVHVCSFSSQRHADLGMSSCSLLNPAHVVSYFVFFFLHLICFAISVSHRSHPEKTRSVSNTRNTPRFSISRAVLEKSGRLLAINIGEWKTVVGK